MYVVIFVVLFWEDIVKWEVWGSNLLSYNFVDDWIKSMGIDSFELEFYGELSLLFDFVDNKLCVVLFIEFKILMIWMKVVCLSFILFCFLFVCFFFLSRFLFSYILLKNVFEFDVLFKYVLRCLVICIKCGEVLFRCLLLS